MKKRILAVLATGLLLVGTTTTCFAASPKLTHSITTEKAVAEFTYTTYGQMLRVEQEVVERDVFGTRVWRFHSNTNGATVSAVSSTRKVTQGYTYEYIEWTKAYVNNVLYSQLGRKEIGNII